MYCTKYLTRHIYTERINTKMYNVHVVHIRTDRSDLHSSYYNIKSTKEQQLTACTIVRQSIALQRVSQSICF